MRPREKKGEEGEQKGAMELREDPSLSAGPQSQPMIVMKAMAPPESRGCSHAHPPSSLSVEQKGAGCTLLYQTSAAFNRQRQLASPLCSYYSRAVAQHTSHLLNPSLPVPVYRVGRAWKTGALGCEEGRFQCNTPGFELT